MEVGVPGQHAQPFTRAGVAAGAASRPLFPAGRPAPTAHGPPPLSLPPIFGQLTLELEVVALFNEALGVAARSAHNHNSLQARARDSGAGADGQPQPGRSCVGAAGRYRTPRPRARPQLPRRRSRAAVWLAALTPARHAGAAISPGSCRAQQAVTLVAQAARSASCRLTLIACRPPPPSAQCFYLGCLVAHAVRGRANVVHMISRVGDLRRLDEKRREWRDAGGSSSAPW